MSICPANLPIHDHQSVPFISSYVLNSTAHHKSIPHPSARKANRCQFSVLLGVHGEKRKSRVWEKVHSIRTPTTSLPPTLPIQFPPIHQPTTTHPNDTVTDLNVTIYLPLWLSHCPTQLTHTFKRFLIDDDDTRISCR